VAPLCTWLGYCASSWARRSGGGLRKYQSSWPSAVSLTACSGVTPTVILIPARWPSGVFGHGSKLGFRVSMTCWLGVYDEIMYGPVATRYCVSVETSRAGVPAG